MRLPKHCPRYSTSRGFAPSLPDWRTIRAGYGEMLDLPEQRRLVSVGKMYEGRLVQVELTGRFWLQDDWKPFLAAARRAAKVQRAWTRALDLGEDGPEGLPPEGGLQYVATLSAAAA